MFCFRLLQEQYMARMFTSQRSTTLPQYTDNQLQYQPHRLPQQYPNVSNFGTTNCSSMTPPNLFQNHPQLSQFGFNQPMKPPHQFNHPNNMYHQHQHQPPSKSHSLHTQTPTPPMPDVRKPPSSQSAEQNYQRPSVIHDTRRMPPQVIQNASPEKPSSFNPPEPQHVQGYSPQSLAILDIPAELTRSEVTELVTSQDQGETDETRNDMIMIKKYVHKKFSKYTCKPNFFGKTWNFSHMEFNFSYQFLESYIFHTLPLSFRSMTFVFQLSSTNRKTH